MRRGTFAGLLLALLGLVLLLTCLIPVTSIEEVINTSFMVSPGTTYGPYDEGTVCHTRIHMKILDKSVLKGDVSVEGEGIYLTVNGYNTQHLKSLYVKGQYSFTVDPADDLYTFTFDNTRGNAENLVKFILKEAWTRPIAIGSPPLFIAGLIGFFLLSTGLVTLAIAHLKSRRNIKKISVRYLLLFLRVVATDLISKV